MATPMHAVQQQRERAMASFRKLLLDSSSQRISYSLPAGREELSDGTLADHYGPLGNTASKDVAPEDRDASVSKVARHALKDWQEAMQIAQGEASLSPEQNQQLENHLRALLQELVEMAAYCGTAVMELRVINSKPSSILNKRGADNEGGAGGGGGGGGGGEAGEVPSTALLLDIVLCLCDLGKIEGGIIFQLLEDLMEESTIEDCKQIFGYIEGKQAALAKDHLLQRGKLVLLRACNLLLRRLSKASDVVFCGRVLTFLAYFFPIAEKSAVNIKGAFNVGNRTDFVKQQSAATEAGAAFDFNFYTTFWRLQELFSNPPVVFTKWPTFTEDLKVVLQAFESQPVEAGETAGGGGVGIGHFNTKFLTSPNLIGLELRDHSFRRHFLVQCLILFDFLQFGGKPEREDKREALKEEVLKLQEGVKKLLRGIPPGGDQFLSSVEHVLERDRHWVLWKRDGCPSFDKPSEKLSNKSSITGKRQRFLLGNRELDKLFRWADKHPDLLTDKERVALPSIKDFVKPLAEDMDPSAGIDAEYSHKNDKVFCWRALRLAAGQDLEGFNRFSEMGIEGVVPPELLTEEVRGKLHGKQAAAISNKTRGKKASDTAAVVSSPSKAVKGKVEVQAGDVGMADKTFSSKETPHVKESMKKPKEGQDISALSGPEGADLLQKSNVEAQDNKERTNTLESAGQDNAHGSDLGQLKGSKGYENMTTNSSVIDLNEAVRDEAHDPQAKVDDGDGDTSRQAQAAEDPNKYQETITSVSVTLSSRQLKEPIPLLSPAVFVHPRGEKEKGGDDESKVSKRLHLECEGASLDHVGSQGVDHKEAEDVKEEKAKRARLG